MSVSHFRILNSRDNYKSERSETAPYCGYGVVHEGNTGAEELLDEIRLVSHVLLAWEKKKSKPNKKSYPEIHQQGEKFCLVLNRCAALPPPHLKNCLELEKDWAVYGWCEGFVPVLLPFHSPIGDEARGQRAGTSLRFHAAKGWVWRGKQPALCNDGEKPASILLHIQRLSKSYHAFLEQGNLPVLPPTWSCLLVFCCFGDRLKSVEIYCFI